MTARSKIVGITRQKPEETEIAEESEDQAISLDPAQDDETLVLEEDAQEQVEEYFEDYDEEAGFDDGAARSNWTSYILPILLGTILVGWTAFFGWVHQSEFATLTSTGKRLACLETGPCPLA